jgi:ferredoxin
MAWVIMLIVIGAVLLGLLGFWIWAERGRPLRRSTWRMMREGGLRRMLNFQGLHGYIYGRWTNAYIKRLVRILPRMRPRKRRRLAEHYHGKVLTPDHAHAIVTNETDIPLQDLEQVIPYPVARQIVLDGPPDVVAYECACRHARENPCRPTQVCMVIGKPFTDFILDHHPKTSRRLDRREALELLRAEHERGHVHSAWFKDACMDRFYAICNCCKCCCGGIDAMVRGGVAMMASSGYVARIDEDKCTGCGACAEICPFEAVHVNEKSAVSWEACMGCGVCVENCPEQAVSLVRDEKKGLPLDVRLLAAAQGKA